MSGCQREDSSLFITFSTPSLHRLLPFIMFSFLNRSLDNSYQICLSSVQRSRPPVKGGATPNDFWMSLEPTTALGLHLLQFVKRGKGPMSERFMGERAQALGWLQFRRMRGQKEEVQSFRKAESTALVPARLIQNQGSVCLALPLVLLRKRAGPKKRLVY
jgi:hypothetical protein